MIFRVLTLAVSVAIGTTSQVDDSRIPAVQLDQQAVKLIMAGKYADAETYITSTKLTEDPVLLAWLKIKQNQQGEGLKMLEERFLAEDPQSLTNLKKLLTVLSDGSPEQGIDLAEQYIQNWKGDATPLKLLLAQIHLKTGKGYPQAVALIEDVLSGGYTGADLEQPVYSLSMYEYEKGHPQESLRHLDALFTAVPAIGLKPEYQVQWANVARRCRRELEAIKVLDRVQSDHPEVYQRLKGHILYSKGIAFDSIGNREEAKKSFDELIALAKTNPQFTAVASVADTIMTHWQAETPPPPPPPLYEREPLTWSRIRPWLLTINTLVIAAAMTVYAIRRARKPSTP